MKGEDRFNELIASYQTGVVSEAEFAELESFLKSSEEARALYHQACRMDAGLRRESESPAPAAMPAARAMESFIAPERVPLATWLAVAAAVVMAAGWVWAQASKPRVVAELTSAENASWESSLPTEPGSKLTKGYMKLMKGIATIRFRSGAEITLEAPAKLTLKGPKRAKLVAGSAVMQVPESAVGFRLETPQGYAVDYGTSFAVTVVNSRDQTDFEVVEGEISVHLPGNEDGLRLRNLEAASIVGRELIVHNGPLPEQDLIEAERPEVERLGTGGRSYSVIRANKAKWLYPEKLLLKRKREPSPHDRRTFFAFDVSATDFDAVESVGIRLNQVPSGIGYAARLPKISRIGVYGLINPEKADWQPGTTWEEGPSREDGVKLGEFEIERSEQRGSHVFSNAALLDFLKANRTGPVTFILDREYSSPTDGPQSLVHAFASDIHPEASGPTLEFILKN